MQTVLQARLATVRASASLPIHSLRSGFDRMCALVSSLVAQLYEGASTQRKLYQQEVARIQEVANMATRKAVSVQREQAASQMEHMRASLATETSRQLEELKAKYQQVCANSWWSEGWAVVEFARSVRRRIGSTNPKSTG